MCGIFSPVGQEALPSPLQAVDLEVLEAVCLSYVQRRFWRSSLKVWYCLILLVNRLGGPDNRGIFQFGYEEAL